MNCPLCPGHTLVPHKRAAIEIDVCPNCGGVWLDRGELERFALTPPTPSGAVDRSGLQDGSEHGRPTKRRARDTWDDDDHDDDDGDDRDDDDRDDDDRKKSKSKKKKKKKKKLSRLADALEDALEDIIDL